MLYLLRRLSEVEPVVTMYAYSRTIEYEGDWISFDEYLRRRFRLETSHGMSPAEFDRMRAAIRR